MEGKNPQLTNILQSGARVVEQQRKDSMINWTSINFATLPVQKNVTWWLRSTMLTDGGTAKEPARFMLECMTYGNKIDAPRWVDKYKLAPTSEEVLQCVF